MRPYRNVDLVGDAMRLPLLDGSVDALMAVSILEHLPRPWEAAAEFKRVLRPGAFAYIETPWMLQVHGYPSDFYRYTIEGLKQLFLGLEVVDSGVSAGCSSAMAILLRKYLVHLAPRPLKGYELGDGRAPVSHEVHCIARREGRRRLGSRLLPYGQKTVLSGFRKASGGGWFPQRIAPPTRRIWDSPVSSSAHFTPGHAAPVAGRNASHESL